MHETPAEKVIAQFGPDQLTRPENGKQSKQISKGNLDPKNPLLRVEPVCPGDPLATVRLRWPDSGPA